MLTECVFTSECLTIQTFQTMRNWKPEDFLIYLFMMVIWSYHRKTQEFLLIING